MIFLVVAAILIFCFFLLVKLTNDDMVSVIKTKSYRSSVSLFGEVHTEIIFVVISVFLELSSINKKGQIIFSGLAIGLFLTFILLVCLSREGSPFCYNYSTVLSLFQGSDTLSHLCFFSWTFYWNCCL